jgi:prepilin-type N-terminal cleavage/methylation domain-containing protein
MIKRARSTRAFTLIEVMITVAICALVATAFFYFLPSQFQYYKHMSVRQQMSLDSRVCIDTIQQRLRNGKASSLVITSPSGTNSRVDFVLQTPLSSGATAYAIYLSNGNVYGREYLPSGVQIPHQLASNVTNLCFTGATTDPGIIGVSLRIDAPYDNSNNPTHVLTLIMPDQEVNMVGSQ